MDIYNMTLIGSGAQADVYLFDNKAVKIFKPEYIQANARYEADIQDRVHKSGLPVPEIYEVTEVNGRTAIIMEYIKGNTIGNIMFEDMENAYKYLDISVDLQIKVHNANTDGFPCQKDKLTNNIISTSYLENEQRQVLLHLLYSLETGNALCHGDFHVQNLIKTVQDIKIIDWVDASCGSIAADVCRSYLLYSLYFNEIADTYLECYCKKANLSQQSVLKWLPVIAGARLNENVRAQDVTMLLHMIDDNFHYKYNV